VSNLGEKVAEGVKRAVAEMGIHATAEVKFQQGPFCVIRVQVTDLDLLLLLSKAKGPEYAERFSNLLTAAGALDMKEDVECKVNKKICSSLNQGMMAKFDEILPKKMAEQNVVVECHSFAQEEETEFFFEMLKTLNSK